MPLCRSGAGKNHWFKGFDRFCIAAQYSNISVLVSYFSGCFCPLKNWKTPFWFLRQKNGVANSLENKYKFNQVKFQNKQACGILRMFAWENYQCVRRKNKAQEINPSIGIQWIHTSCHHVADPPHTQVLYSFRRSPAWFLLWQCSSKLQCLKVTQWLRTYFHLSLRNSRFWKAFLNVQKRISGINHIYMYISFFNMEI